MSAAASPAMTEPEPRGIKPASLISKEGKNPGFVG
jgi:hypothetical protein